jgi:hypothetical protein
MEIADTIVNAPVQTVTYCIVYRVNGRELALWVLLEVADTDENVLVQAVTCRVKGRGEV